MIIARELRKQNIAEYLIYMFQLEDLVRAFNANIDLIYEHHIKHFEVDDQLLSEIKKWYETLCQLMREENLLEKGHLQFLRHKMQELENLHWQLLNSSEHETYKTVFFNCQNDLEVFKIKSLMKENGDVESALTALYSIYLMRLKKKEIYEETNQAIERISRWISLLAKYYHEIENGTNEIY